MLSERRSGLAESVWRAAFGIWLLLHFATLSPLGAFGMLAALLFAVGWRERGCAALLWWLAAAAAEPWRSDWIVLLLLATHVALPPAPYGSLSARGRVDPGGGWSMPNWILRLRFAALIAFGVYALFPGAAWVGPVAGLLALVVPERALGWAWLLLCAAAIWAASMPGEHGSREFLWLALAANFQPGWFPARAATALEWVFYDGTCALCHGVVRFLLAEDAKGEAFRFAPLDSDALRAAIPEAERRALPDSFVVRTADGRTLLRSDAVLHVLGRLGGWWRLAAEVGRFIPRPLRDFAYSCVAAVRKRVFGTKTEACPLLPKHLRGRFG